MEYKKGMETELDKQKTIVELPIVIPLITEDDLLHKEMIGYTLYLTAGILLNSQTDGKTEDEMQIIRVYGIINKILFCYKSINQASNFIKRRPTITELDNNEEMTVIDYYNYHYDVIVHKLSTIRDLSFKLINKVYNLQLKDRNCNWDNIWKKRNLISVPGILDIQTLLYNFMEEIQRDRNESSHNGTIDIRTFKDIDGFVQMSQWKRMGKLPEEVIGPDPMAKGTYYDYLLKKNKNELLAKISNFKTASLFCIHVLTCCMANKFISDIPRDMLEKYSEFIQEANHGIDAYKRKINKLDQLFPYLIRNDGAIERIKNQKANEIFRFMVSFHNV